MAEREAIIYHVTTLLDSEQFSSSPALAKLLTFCVNTTLAGEEQSLKETTIGISVFGRPPGYDTKLDPIVRVNARRLRQKLELFYQNTDKNHEVQITIPKGSYVPRFERPAPESQVTVTALDYQAAAVLEESVPVPEAQSTQWPGTLTGALPAGLLWAIVSLTFLIAVSFFAFFRSHLVAKTAAAQHSLPRLHPVTSLSGAKTDPSLSPDGSEIAFSWDSDKSGTPHIYLQHRNSATPNVLTRTSYPEVRPVWSGDGKAIALLRQIKPAVYALVLVDVASRNERVVRTLAFSYQQEKPALDWSRDGKWLVANEQVSDKPAHLLLISSSDGVSTQLTDPPDGSTGDLEARFSPAANEIAFRRGQLGELFLASMKVPNEAGVVPLTFSNPGVRGISWSPDGGSIFFGSMNGGGVPGIWRFNRNNSSATLITPPGVAAISPSVSRDGSEILFTSPLSQLSLWQYKAAADSGGPHPFGPLTALQITPSISPDGKMVVFASDISGAMELWVSSIDNPSPRQLTSFNGSGIPVFPSWSADSQKVVFFCRRKGLNYAYEVMAQGGSLRLLRGGVDYTLYPQYSPDNKWLYYLSNYGRRFRVWRVSLADLDSTPEEVTMQDVNYFRLAADGRSLYFSSRAGNITDLIRKDLTTGQTETVWEWKQAPIGTCDWDVSKGRLYFVSADTGSLGSHLVTADLRTHVSRDLGSVRMTYWFGTTSIAAAPDGGSVWISKLDHDDSNMMSLPLY
jgi:Tol biopolymer transport system component